MKKTEHIHFIGIGGYGMSAIARVLLEMGHKITGSDVAEQGLTKKLVEGGALIHYGHKAEYVHGADTVVYSTALPEDNAERVEAQRLGISTLHRSQMLARLLNERKGIAVAGAHGKTTTSSMTALAMEKCGADPTYIIGGEIVGLGTNAKAGSSEFVVAEADESDGTFLQYHPYISIVTNIEADHLENYDGSFEKIKEAYVQFLNQTREDGFAIVCADDENLRELMPRLNSKLITYGMGEDADYRISDMELGDRRAAFTVSSEGRELGRVELFVPGKYNVYNATAALIACIKAGIPFEEAAIGLSQFHGAKRRFQVLADTAGVLVVDDYAHHPTEIEATLRAAKSTGKRIVAVFQPQRYTRTFFLLDAFSRAFAEADEVIIVDIYSPAGEEPIEGVNSAVLTDLIKQNSNSNARYLATKEEVLEDLTGRIQDGDLVITMGAGDIWKVSHAFADDWKGKAL
ncbi:UDP-N-acetylmuramate--L-alanine ligase [Saccharibacillus kuerlensis]|uniref:UDP-N-acetylmuramate--L-alanine ligase n=1 Tax=Saccharibacillus kuerlensis TaxID=459527 RepID=A0ABQ2L7B8_9BACL|nr:UDP-N-acetylmuramate--L-alanine ligase [Saccharibacillus kuerlensis]GGO05753.1 UDP-N-acetylmuramate--L-alanine ligase [Saccharibacillus kuerlensis]